MREFLICLLALLILSILLLVVYPRERGKHELETAAPRASCVVEEWNERTTDSFPFHDDYKNWTAIKLTGVEGLYDGDVRLVSALQFENFSVVTMAHQDIRHVGTPIHCRYFDCNRHELPNTTFESFVFPLSAVHCPLRAGAKFMSLSWTEHDDEPVEPIPVEPRLFKVPPNEIGVCVGQIYGEERKWLQIVEFVEHHRLIGASMFYFTIFEMDGYTKRVIEEYRRIGLVEASFVNTEYAPINILFHQVQLHECFFRSKFHSKWVINVDIDERFVMSDEHPLPTFLSTLDHSLCELVFSSKRVPKMSLDPKRFVNETQLLSDMEFLKYQNVTDASWAAPKIIFQPARVHNIYMHWSWRQYPGCRIAAVPTRVGYCRHYRFVNKSGLGSNWLHGTRTHASPLNATFGEQLKQAVVRRVKFLYDVRPIPCAKIAKFFLRNYGNDTLKCV